MKLLIVGDSGVGKTCILLRVVNDSFDSKYIPTVGIDYRTKPLNFQNEKIKLQIWELSGRRKFLDYVGCHFNGAIGVVFVYDVTNEESFRNINKWFQFVNECAADHSIRKLLLANKCDMDHERVISRREGINMAKQLNADFLETSAKLNINITKAFINLAERRLCLPSQEILPLTLHERPDERNVGGNAIFYFLI